MISNDMLNEISKKIHKLETEYQHELFVEWKKKFVAYAIKKLEEGSVSKGTFRSYETFLENCVDDVSFFYPVYEQAMIVAQHMQSSWSGGHSVSNMLEYIQRNVAINFICKRVSPLIIGMISMTIFAKRLQKWNGQTKSNLLALPM